MAVFTGTLPDEVVKPADGGDLDISRFLLDAVQKLNIDFEVEGSITDGSLRRTMAGASALTVTIADPSRALLNSHIWEYTLDVDLDGLYYRFVQLNKSGDLLTLTFEDRIVAWMRQHRKPMKASRAHMTRAEFIKKMVVEIQADNKANMPIAFFSPELHKKQDIASVKKKKQEVRRSRREGGLHKVVDVKIKNTQANGKQIDALNKALDVSVDLNANTKVQVAMIMTGIQESTWDVTQTNGSHVGIFQQDSTKNPPSVWVTMGGATRKPGPDAHAFLVTCIQQDKAHPSYSLAALCESVQHSGQPTLYAQWEREARKIVEEYGGGGLDTTIERNFFKQYVFSRGKPGGPKGENSWTAGTRLADEVRWRLFVVGNTIYYVADRDLIHSMPIGTFTESTEEIHSIDFDFDTGKKVNEATLVCDAGRWFAHPGEVVELKEMGPGNGRWLVWEIERSLYGLQTTITLHRAQDPKKEPAPELASVQKKGDAIIQGQTIDGKSVRDRIVNAALQALKIGPKKYHYSHNRPIPKSLFQKGIISTDCSGFACLCYKAAGAGDPNGTNYDGNAYTGTMMQHGHKTTHPVAGDLVFYRSPEHVMVYIGDGEVVGMGGDPDPTRVPVHYRSDLIGYFQFDLSGGPVQGFSQEDTRGPKAGH
jgi:hypothetical protein